MRPDYEDDDLKIYKAAFENNWKSVSDKFEQRPELMTKQITKRSETPLMIAVGSKCHEFVGLLLDRIVAVGDAHKLSETNKSGKNALHYAAMVGNEEDARKLVEKNPYMILAQDKDRKTPLLLAAWHKNKEMFQHLLETVDLLPGEEEGSPFTGVAGGDLITLTINAGFLDMAIKISTWHPDIVLAKNKEDQTALQVLAAKPELFSSGSRRGYWGDQIYLWIPIKERQEDLQVTIRTHRFNKFYAGLWKVLQKMAPPIKDIHDLKKTHYKNILFIRYLCKRVIEKGDHDVAWQILGPAIFAAVKHGIKEVVNICIEYYPDIFWYTNNKGIHLSREAIMQRREDIYSILSQHPSHKVFLAKKIYDKNNNNLLHEAAKLARPHLFHRATGAALQMQFELKWFEEVAKLMEPWQKDALNKKGKTPKMIFDDEHRGLLRDAKQWMKDTSSSCTVVAALIVTITFAAAFTVPGGNEDDGKPMFLNKGIFMLFIVSDAFALFFSSTSLLMFLGILISGYAEDDFLYVLPNRMAIGLVDLFLSLITTMVAFSATLALVLQYKVTWIATPLIIATNIPVVLFGLLQFPQFAELIYSTYRPSIFQQNNRRIH